MDDLSALLADLSAQAVRGRDDKTRREEFRALFMGTEVGRRVLSDILAMGHLYQSSMMPDPHATAFKEGERNLALRILDCANRQIETPADRQKRRD